MPANRESLLAGRRLAPLNQKEITRAINTFLGLDRAAPVRYQEGRPNGLSGHNRGDARHRRDRVRL